MPRLSRWLPLARPDETSADRVSPNLGNKKPGNLPLSYRACLSTLFFGYPKNVSQSDELKIAEINN